MTADKSGFVYVMTKESSPFCYKIGRTEKKPQLRAAELDGTDSPFPSIVVYYAFCEDHVTVEALAAHRIRSNREWFKCDKAKAVSTIKMVAQNQGVQIHFEKNDFWDPHLEAENRSESGTVDAMPSKCSDGASLSEKGAAQRLLDDIAFACEIRDVEIERYARYLEQRRQELKIKKWQGEDVVGLMSWAESNFHVKKKEILEDFKNTLERCAENAKQSLSPTALCDLTDLANRLLAGETLEAIEDDVDVSLCPEPETLNRVEFKVLMEKFRISRR